MAREDRFGRGSDKSSFSQQGYPAIVFREANEDFGRQHSANDTLDGVDFAYLTQNARVNAAAMASLALAPPAPVITGERRAPPMAATPRATARRCAGRPRRGPSPIASIGATPGPSTGSAPAPSAASGRSRCRGVDRRLGVRRGGDRSGRPREPDQRLRVAEPSRTTDRAREVAPSSNPFLVEFLLGSCSKQLFSGAGEALVEGLARGTRRAVQPHQSSASGGGGHRFRPDQRPGLGEACPSQVWPHRFLGAMVRIPGMSLIVSPIANGLFAMGGARPVAPSARDRPRTYLSTFWGAALFAFSVAAVRFWLLPAPADRQLGCGRPGSLQHAAGCADSLSRRHPCWL